MLNLAGCSKSDEQSNQNPDTEDKHVVKDAKYWQDLLNLSDEELNERLGGKYGKDRNKKND